jgi:hypothetical protein
MLQMKISGIHTAVYTNARNTTSIVAMLATDMQYTHTGKSKKNVTYM